jgi:hypothetical protein
LIARAITTTHCTVNWRDRAIHCRTATACKSGRKCPNFRDNALSTSIGQRGTTSVMQSTINNRPKSQECHGARETIRLSGIVQVYSHERRNQLHPTQSGWQEWNPHNKLGQQWPVTTFTCNRNSTRSKNQPQCPSNFIESSHTTQQSPAIQRSSIV